VIVHPHFVIVHPHFVIVHPHFVIVHPHFVIVKIGNFSNLNIKINKLSPIFSNFQKLHKQINTIKKK
jgi:hypothetical protein